MHFTFVFPAILSVAFAIPAPAVSDSVSALEVDDVHYHPQFQATTWATGAVAHYPIHPSCNSTKKALIERGLFEAQVMAEHAKEHILRYGNSSRFYQRWFGSGHTAEPIGWFEKIVANDKSGLLFRCDDIDGNCRIPGYGGHWRGSNASDETVICDLSFTTRRPIEGVCGYGYDVATGSTTSYWSGDLLHRLYHTDKIGEGVVGHYADSVADCLQLARNNSANAIRNSATLRYFAMDVYAYDLAVPGIGCTGTLPVVPSGGSSASTAAASSAASSVATSRASSVAAAAATSSATRASSTGAGTTTSSAAQECHTHADGVVHCA